MIIRSSKLTYLLPLVAFGLCYLTIGASQGKPEVKVTTSQIQEGKRLFKTLQCSSCHSINNVGGCIAPPLDQVTKRRSSDYLRLRLDDTKEDQFIALLKHPELFPHPRFKPRQVDALIAYLGTLSPQDRTRIQNLAHGPVKQDRDVPAVKLPWQQPEISPSIREGRRLFLETGCMACHSAGTTGGSTGPALDGIGTRHSRKYIQAHITDPTGHLKNTTKLGKSKMTQADLQPDQIKAITDFLLTLPPSGNN